MKVLLHTKVLLHICCAPCASASIEALRAEGAELAGTYFNPNIQPYAEHQLRYDTLTGYAASVGLPLLGDPHYDVAAWLRMVAGNDAKPERCRLCIAQRLTHTAQLAADRGFDTFSTTLLISPWQEHGIIREEGDRAAAQAGVRFLYRDLRPHYRRSRELAREEGLYRQKYCGCIYSENEAALERAERKRLRKAGRAGRNESRKTSANR